MMANVALRNWRFLYNMGMTGFRWFEGVGNYTEVRKTALIGANSATISPDSPVVLPLKVLYSYPGLPAADQGHRGSGGASHQEPLLVVRELGYQLIGRLPETHIRSRLF